MLFEATHGVVPLRAMKGHTPLTNEVRNDPENQIVGHNTGNVVNNEPELILTKGPGLVIAGVRERD